MARQSLILRQVDIRLPVFDPHAHRQGLRNHGYPGGVEHGEGIPRAVAQGQDYLFRR